MKLKKITLFTLLLFLSVSISFSQKHSLTGITNFSGSAISPIFDRSEVKGYMLFYRMDKADKKNDNYAIDVYDDNLDKVKNITMQKPARSYTLLRNSYNGSVFSFYFYNYRKSELEIEIYDKGLNKIASHKIDKLSKVDNGYIQQELKNGGSNGNNIMGGMNLFPVPEKGFIRNSYEGMAKSYNLEMYDNNLNLKWTYTPTKNDSYESIGITEVTDKYVLGTIVRRPGMLSKKLTFYVAAFDINNGEKILDVPVETSVNEQLALSSITFDDQKNEFLVLGEFYDLKDKPFVNKSQGFFIKRFGVDGKEKSYKLYNWNKEVKNLLPLEANKSIENNYINYIQKIIKDAKGNMYLVAEQYKVVVSGAGIAAQALGGKASTMKGKIGNILIFSIDPKDQLKEVKFYQKDETDCLLPAGSGWMGAGLLGHVIKMQNGFDFQFTQSNVEATDFSVAYLNLEKIGKENKQSLVNIIIDDSGNFITDSIDVTSTKSERSYTYPGKVGYNMIVDYSIKDKVMDMKLVKLNR